MAEYRNPAVGGTPKLPAMSSASVSSSPSALPPASARQDAGVIGLIGLAHGTSHFFHLLLPPMFPVFAREFGLNFAELGLLVTVFFAISGIGQALAGFVVDRVGARPVLFGALVCFAAASVAAALAPGYAGLVLAAALAGVGNAPFHPADFTILNKRVSPPRLGHAFSVHSISGNLGWALAPVFLIGLTEITGNWRLAYAGTAVVALGVLVLLLWQRARIDDREVAWPEAAARPAAAPSGASGARAVPAVDEHPMAFLKLPAVWLCFSFFFWTTASLSAIQGFAGPALSALHGLPLSATAFVITGYMVCGAVGMVIGGFLVARAERLERTIGLCLAGAAGLLLLASTGWLPSTLAMAVVALAGVGTGLASPSRDMLIKRASPPGATGRVYGTVYSGLDVGFALAAPIFGWLMDHGQPQAVFVGAALLLFMAIVSATVVGTRLSPRSLVPGSA